MEREHSFDALDVDAGRVALDTGSDAIVSLLDALSRDLQRGMEQVGLLCRAKYEGLSTAAFRRDMAAVRGAHQPLKRIREAVARSLTHAVSESDKWFHRAVGDYLDEWPKGTRTTVAKHVLTACRRHGFHQPKPDEMSALAVLAGVDSWTLALPTETQPHRVTHEQWLEMNDFDEGLKVRKRRRNAWGRALEEARAQLVHDGR